jgi:hypothetical protein
VVAGVFGESKMGSGIRGLQSRKGGNEQEALPIEGHDVLLFGAAFFAGGWKFLSRSVCGRKPGRRECKTAITQWVPRWKVLKKQGECFNRQTPA